MDIVKEKKGGTEKHWVEKIREGDKDAFEQLFFEYFYDLCSFAFQMTHSNERAKDIVQEVFYKLWKRRKSWTIHSSLKAYLFRSVRNEALNEIDSRQYWEEVKEQFKIRKKTKTRQSGRSTEIDRGLIKEIWKVVSEMPKRRRSVFVLHRKHGLSHKEIARVLDISRKTVENHMGLALDDIRKQVDLNIY
jgi:RNA polymerase sigma-70 factor (ECF subfamily)